MKIPSVEQKKIYNENWYIIDEDENARQFMCSLYLRSIRLRKIKNQEYQDYFEEQLKLLKKYNLKGDKLGIFFYHMCSEDWIKYELSLYMLEFDYYTKEELINNMESNFPLPLVYEKYNGQEDEALFNYFNNQRAIFDERKKTSNKKLKFIMNR
jgi:hypothetical protein